jgi:hypothetical protein
MTSQDRTTVLQFAVDHQVSASTVYRWLKLHPAPDKRGVDGETTYSVLVLNEAKRLAKFKGVRNIQNKMDVSIRSLAGVGFAGIGVDEQGGVYNLVTRERFKTRRRTDGYVVVDLGAYKTQYVHRLVAAAFHGAPPRSTHTVDHLNGNSSDNRAENLEWVTADENNRRQRLRRFPSKHQPFKFTKPELHRLEQAFALELSFADFKARQALGTITISSSHYYRLSADFRSKLGPLPEWIDIPRGKRFLVINAILRKYDFDEICGQVAARRDNALRRNNAADARSLKPLRLEEYTVLMRWAVFHDLFNQAHRAVQAYEAANKRTVNPHYLPSAFSSEVRRLARGNYVSLSWRSVRSSGSVWLPVPGGHRPSTCWSSDMLTSAGAVS